LIAARPEDLERRLKHVRKDKHNAKEEAKNEEHSES
jgi:hypothetical protein